MEQLTEEILSLPSASRALLADKLVESLEFETNSSIQEIWLTEAKRRRNEVRDDSVQPIPGEQALAQVKRLIEIRPSVIPQPLFKLALTANVRST